MNMRNGPIQAMFGKQGLMVALLTAVLYFLMIIPYKHFTILDTITGIRPGAAIPVMMAILFGPGAALGAAFGNLMGDIFGGSLTMGSIGGFIGNFAFAFVAWVVWNELEPIAREKIDIRSVGHYLVAAIVASVVCALTIAVGLEIFGLADLAWIFGVISLNDIAWTCTLGLVAFVTLYEVTTKYRVGSVSEDEDVPKSKNQ
jgi:energy-coupling factor transport system substrate-specific component